MSEKELLLIATVIVGLFLLVKFWRFFLQVAVVGGLIIGGLYIYQQSQQSGHGGSNRYSSNDGFNNPSFSRQSAINKVKSYLATVSAKKYEPRSVPRRVSRQCRDYCSDVNREECKKRYKTEVKYTYDTVWETKNVEVPGPCRYPPRGGNWNAFYNSSSQTWTVVNEGSERGRLFRWDVSDRTGQVSSHQPPC